MITQDLSVAAEEGYIRYGASNYSHTPDNIMNDILNE